MKFRTIIADPPWPYDRTSASRKLTGYADKQYELMSIDQLSALSLSPILADDCVLLMWATWPFIPDALRVISAWGFRFKTGLPWIKASHIDAAAATFKPMYGVGYWLRGCTEPLLIASRGMSHRTSWVGLLSENAKHSRKPTTIYELAHSFPGPYLELFGRSDTNGWWTLGNDPSLAMSGDIDESLKLLEYMP